VYTSGNFTTPVMRRTSAKSVQILSGVHKQGESLVKATAELTHVVSNLHKNASMVELAASNHRMAEIESHGDALYQRAMADLFSGEFEAIEIIKLRDLYKVIESALDGCSIVSENVVNIVLKQG